MRRLFFLIIGLLLMVPSLILLTDIRKSTPPKERLGYIPSFEVAYFSSLEYRLLISELVFYDAVFYYGTMLDSQDERPDYGRIYKYVDTSTRLNPYNIDAYYFGQAILTWDAGMVRQTNNLLLRGMSKRSWDYYIPFFLGFNYSYFLREYDMAAKYMARAAVLNPSVSFLASLAGRLYYQANRTDLAIQYLVTVYEGTRNEAVKRALRKRIVALKRIAFLEEAVKRYQAGSGHAPRELDDLVQAGMLKGIPMDPYGGRFYLDLRDGRIKTTSNLADTRSKQ